VPRVTKVLHRGRGGGEDHADVAAPGVPDPVDGFADPQNVEHRRGSGGALLHRAAEARIGTRPVTRTGNEHEPALR
jgi:hypothetical protein